MRLIGIWSIPNIPDSSDSLHKEVDKYNRRDRLETSPKHRPANVFRPTGALLAARILCLCAFKGVDRDQQSPARRQSLCSSSRR